MQVLFQECQMHNLDLYMTKALRGNFPRKFPRTLSEKSVNSLEKLKKRPWKSLFPTLS